MDNNGFYNDIDKKITLFLQMYNLNFKNIKCNDLEIMIRMLRLV